MLLFVIVALAALVPSATYAQEDGVPEAQHVRVHVRIVLLDRAEARRAGLQYVQIGDGRIRVEGGRGRRGTGAGASGEVAGIPVSAFVQLARDRRLLRSETQAHVTALAGATASIASGNLSVSGWGMSRSQGPELVVTPTLLEDGRVRLDVRARLRDEVTDGYGYGVDASPVDASTTVIVRPGETATIGNVRTATERTDAGLLHWEDASGSRDVLVVLTPELVEP